MIHSNKIYAAPATTPEELFEMLSQTPRDRPDQSAIIKTLKNLPDNSLVETEGNDIAGILGILCDRNEVELAKIFIPKIDISSRDDNNNYKTSGKNHYSFLQGVINMRGNGGKNCASVQIARLLVNHGFDPGFVLKHGDEDEDAFQIAVQQNQSVSQNNRQTDSPSPISEEIKLQIEADSEMIKCFLRSGKVIGFLDQAGNLEADKIEKLEDDPQALLDHFKQFHKRKITTIKEEPNIAEPSPRNNPTSASLFRRLCCFIPRVHS